MKIQRTINGMKFNILLLPHELAEAYEEYQSKLDVEYVVSYAEAFSDNELKDYFDCDYFEFLEKKEQIAVAMRKHFDKDNMSLSEARDEAIREVINNKIAV